MAGRNHAGECGWSKFGGGIQRAGCVSRAGGAIHRPSDGDGLLRWIPPGIGGTPHHRRVKQRVQEAPRLGSIHCPGSRPLVAAVGPNTSVHSSSRGLAPLADPDHTRRQNPAFACGWVVVTAHRPATARLDYEPDESVQRSRVRRPGWWSDTRAMPLVVRRVARVIVGAQKRL
jgi:hypothetical protein